VRQVVESEMYFTSSSHKTPTVAQAS
jgi:hypothetical protein